MSAPGTTPLTADDAGAMFLVGMVVLMVLIAVLHVVQMGRLDALEEACAVEQVEVER